MKTLVAFPVEATGRAGVVVAEQTVDQLLGTAKGWSLAKAPK